MINDDGRPTVWIKGLENMPDTVIDSGRANTLSWIPDIFSDVRGVASVRVELANGTTVTATNIGIDKIPGRENHSQM